MDKKLYRIYQAAQGCGFATKHRISSETGKMILAFKPMDIPLDLYFFFAVDGKANELKFVDNVSHELFLISENFDPHTETKKYLEKIGAGLNQYTAIYSSMNDLAWKVRKLWLSL